MTRTGTLNRAGWRRITLGVTLAAVVLLQGCASTIGNIALGVGIGAVGAVSALGCALTCH